MNLIYWNRGKKTMQNDITGWQSGSEGGTEFGTQWSDVYPDTVSM